MSRPRYRSPARYGLAPAACMLLVSMAHIAVGHERAPQALLEQLEKLGDSRTDLTGVCERWAHAEGTALAEIRSKGPETLIVVVARDQKPSEITEIQLSSSGVLRPMIGMVSDEAGFLVLRDVRQYRASQVLALVRSPIAEYVEPNCDEWQAAKPLKRGSSPDVAATAFSGASSGRQGCLPGDRYHCVRNEKIFASVGWKWKVARRSEGRTVAVLDSGIACNHEDLTGRIWCGPSAPPGSCVAPAEYPVCPHEGGIDLVHDGDPGPCESSDPTAYCNPHGTRVAGLIGAKAGNGKGIAGMAPLSTLMSVQVMSGNSDDIGSLSELAGGIVFAAAHGASVLNISGHWSWPSRAVRRALEYATRVRSAVVLASSPGAGYSTGLKPYPAAFAHELPGVVDVAEAQLGHDGSWIILSTVLGAMRETTLAAPAKAITTSINKCNKVDYSDFGLASESTALVSGAVSLVWGMRSLSSCSGLEILSLMRACATEGSTHNGKTAPVVDLDFLRHVPLTTRGNCRAVIDQVIERAKCEGVRHAAR